jgi:hypothetical protein
VLDAACDSRRIVIDLHNSPNVEVGADFSESWFLLRDLVMFEVHLDNNLRHRLGMAANLHDFFVGQRLSFFAKQLTTARERNQLGPRICTINELHGAPLERES